MKKVENIIKKINYFHDFYLTIKRKYYMLINDDTVLLKLFGRLSFGFLKVVLHRAV
ncbi:MAG: hypothetical protein LBP93_00930 [Treponema sp.]|nr:hypothetical protein [Treponema sp.]